MSVLNREILRTLCFGDALGLALSPAEIQRWLGVDKGVCGELGDIVAALEEDELLRRETVHTHGFFALQGRENLLAKRQEMLAIGEEKWLIAARAFGRLRHVPWIRLAAVCNTVAMGGARRESDIDCFLIVAPGRLWAARLFAHLALALGGLARRGKAVEDRVCLSFCLTERAMDLRSIAKMPSDPYLAAWLSTLLPVFETHGAHAGLLAANPWLARLLPNAEPRSAAAARAFRPSPAAVFFERITAGMIGDLIERAARAFQRPRIFSNPSSRVHEQNSDVVVTDDMLKFHESDKREEIRAAFERRAASYGV